MDDYRRTPHCKYNLKEHLESPVEMNTHHKGAWFSHEKFIKLLIITGICVGIAMIINAIIKTDFKTPVIDKQMTCAGKMSNDIVLHVDWKQIEEERLAREEEKKREEEEKKRKEEEERQRIEEEKKKEEAERLKKEAESWEEGVASAYGGHSDAAVPDNARTATGAVVNENSMGVAIPIAWGRSDLYGRKILIEYNGEVVEAKINDCGGMGGGSRSLDLQPGVFHEFGFDTCDEWGLRTVRYKIV